MTPFDHLHTSTVSLRRLRLADAPAIFERYGRDAVVTRFLSWSPARSVREVEDFVLRMEAQAAAGRTHTYVLMPAGERELCGALDFRPQGTAIRVGYVLARSHWGRGLMSAALTAVRSWALAQPDCFRVEAICHLDNRGSSRVMEKAGLVFEARLARASHYLNLSAEPQDCLLYAAVR